MKNKNLATEALIGRFLKGELTVAEEKMLLEWIDQSPRHEALFRKEQERLLNSLAKADDPDADRQWRQLSFRIKQNQIIRKNRLKPLWFRLSIPAAAALCMLALLTWLLLDLGPARDSKLAAGTTIITTQNGERKTLLLSDGTKVTLNANSRLTFPKTFPKRLRRIGLSGEAFFEVVPNRKAPFIVHTAALDVRVLGTAFNVQAFPDAEEVNTTLVHGKVVLEKEVNSQKTTLEEMDPNDHVVFHIHDQKIMKQKQANLEQYIGWKDGKLIFLNASIEEMAKKLELWYNVRVRIQGENLKKSHFTGTFTNETVDEALRLLQISFPFEFTVNKINENDEANAPGLEIILSSGNE